MVPLLYLDGCSRTLIVWIGQTLRPLLGRQLGEWQLRFFLLTSLTRPKHLLSAIWWLMSDRFATGIARQIHIWTCGASDGIHGEPLADNSAWINGKG